MSTRPSDQLHMPVSEVGLHVGGRMDREQREREALSANTVSEDWKRHLRPSGRHRGRRGAAGEPKDMKWSGDPVNPCYSLAALLLTANRAKGWVRP